MWEGLSIFHLLEPTIQVLSWWEFQILNYEVLNSLFCLSLIWLFVQCLFLMKGGFLIFTPAIHWTICEICQWESLLEGFGGWYHCMDQSQRYFVFRPWSSKRMFKPKMKIYCSCKGWSLSHNVELVLNLLRLKKTDSKFELCYHSSISALSPLCHHIWCASFSDM